MNSAGAGDDIVLIERFPDIDDYLRMRAVAGMHPKTREAAERALPNTLYGVRLERDGQVVGINSAIATSSGTQGQGGSIGLGFAIPIDQATRVAQEIMQSRRGGPSELVRIGGGYAFDPLEVDHQGGVPETSSGHQPSVSAKLAIGSISRRTYADRSTPKRDTMSRHKVCSLVPSLSLT